jgi:ribonuclease P protein component
MARAQAELLRPSSIATLKHRSEFLRIRHGGRCAMSAFVLEGRPREESKGAAASTARFGFTVSKKVGGAVERNRIKRRLKAAVRDVAGQHARCDYDYVLVARRAALEADYSSLLADLAHALDRVHSAPSRAAGRTGVRTARDQASCG